MSKAIRCVFMRGGTSKGVFLSEADLPVEPEERERVINTNRKRLLLVGVPVADGWPMTRGDYAIPPVPNTGARTVFVDDSEIGVV